MADGFPYLAARSTPFYAIYAHDQHTHNSPNGRLFHRLRTATAPPEGRLYTTTYIVGRFG